jgi:hypothetical protein
MSQKEITAAGLLGVDFTVGKRWIIAGPADGPVSLIYVDAMDYEVKSLNRQLHREKVASIVVDQAIMRWASVDACGAAFLTQFKFWAPKCHFEMCAVRMPLRKKRSTREAGLL